MKRNAHADLVGILMTVTVILIADGIKTAYLYMWKPGPVLLVALPIIIAIVYNLNRRNNSPGNKVVR